ncbi:metallophosphoesterase [candidate division KSB1 bacterium]|nr:metallophosphoesterase [candidate division KSB1 bacterium]MBL7094465.1 metallophosphoesterase [candidate division KSB1 bacterium]
MENVNNIGIMSDSHDNLAAIRAAVELFNREKVDLVIHAGDLVAPFTAREIKKLRCPYKIVLGNNDGEILGLYKIYDGNVFQPPFFLSVGGQAICVLHDPCLLKELKESQNYDVIIYGHDHKPFVEQLTDGTIIVNPGECGGWVTGKSTVAILNLSSREVKIVDIPQRDKLQ